MGDIVRPSPYVIESYLNKWNDSEHYVCQEKSLNKLFKETYCYSNDLDEVLIKVSALNDFYSTNIRKTYNVAKHICALDIDKRLSAGDLSLVNEISYVKMGNKFIDYFSFATKYCSHHYPDKYPIYDSFVVKMLTYFKAKDQFCAFKQYELRTYKIFYDVLKQFRIYYDLEEFSFKEIDQYLWQVGKENFSIF